LKSYSYSSNKLGFLATTGFFSTILFYTGEKSPSSSSNKVFLGCCFLIGLGIEGKGILDDYFGGNLGIPPKGVFF
jgi:hypothetical protein